MIKGIGTDIVEHERINLKIARKILTSKEMIQFNSAANQVEFLASRFAAKEAIIKASNKQFLISDIELCNLASGKLISNIDGMHVTISHEKKYSTAFAVWEV